jgi:dienelactone hydrolase
MKNKLPAPASRQNRRTFLKSQAVLGMGALTAGIGFPASGASSRQPDQNRDLSQDDLLAKYEECLGGKFPGPIPLKPQLRETLQKDGYRIESITYEGLPGERIPALILIPDHVTTADPAPGIAVWHQHNGEYHLGKSEPAGLAGNPMHYTAVAIVREGYVVLCPDSMCFEERQDPTGKLKDGDFERFEFLREVVRGRCLAWKDVFDMKQSISMLCERPEVNIDLIGCYGHSMGSTHSWLVGPLEPRIKCVVGNCCLPTYEAIEQNHILHCFPNFVPGWKKYGDTPDIASMIAPRALHLNFGEKDEGSPIEFVKMGLKRIADAYNKKGVPENFTWFIEPGAGHVLSEAMWQQAKTFFAQHLPVRG